MTGAGRAVQCVDGGMFVGGELESEQIEWWLASWGDACEVLAPARLRQRMLSRLQATLGLYAATPLTHEGASR